MIAMNFIEGLMFIGVPAAFVIAIISGIWVANSDHPIARQERGGLSQAEYKRQQSLRYEYEDDGRNRQLEEEMKTYYSNKNYDRATGRE